MSNFRFRASQRGLFRLFRVFNGDIASDRRVVFHAHDRASASNPFTVRARRIKEQIRVTSFSNYSVARTCFTSALYRSRLITCVLCAFVDAFNACAGLMNPNRSLAHVSRRILNLRSLLGQVQVSPRIHRLKGQSARVRSLHLFHGRVSLLRALGEDRLNLSLLHPVTRVIMNGAFINYRNMVSARRIPRVVARVSNENAAQGTELCVDRLAARFIPLSQRVVQNRDQLRLSQSLQRTRVEFELSLGGVQRKLGFPLSEFHCRFFCLLEDDAQVLHGRGDLLSCREQILLLQRFGREVCASCRRSDRGRVCGLLVLWEVC